MPNTENSDNGAQGGAGGNQQVEIPDKFRNEDGGLNQEALLKSYTELQGHTSQVINDNKALRELVESRNERGEIVAGLQKVVEAVTPKPEEETQVDFNEWVKQHEEEWETPAEALRAYAPLQDSWHRKDLERVKEEANEKVNSLASKIDSLTEMLSKNDATYVENRERVDQLVERGIDLNTAKEIAAEEAERLKALETPRDKVTPPGSVPDGRTTSAPQSKPEPRYSEAEVEQMKREGFTDEQIAGLQSGTYVKELK